MILLMYGVVCIQIICSYSFAYITARFFISFVVLNFPGIPIFISQTTGYMYLFVREGFCILGSISYALCIGFDVFSVLFLIKQYSLHEKSTNEKLCSTCSVRHPFLLFVVFLASILSAIYVYVKEKLIM